MNNTHHTPYKSGGAKTSSSSPSSSSKTSSSAASSARVSGLTAFSNKLGIPPTLFWGFVGMLIFMVGDGVELGYLEPFLSSRGIGNHAVAVLFTVYGVAVAISSWLSGALSNIWGPRRVMWAGLVIWASLEVAFLTFGVGKMNYSMMLLTYGLRGFGYPLFTYGFLVWIAAATPDRKLGTAVGWFWVAYAAGLPTLGSLVASFTIPMIGTLGTFWLSLGMVICGALIALLGIKDHHGDKRLAPVGESPLKSLAGTISIMWREPKTSLGGVVRIINTTSMFGFLVVLPSYFISQIGFTLEEWLRLLTIVFVSNIIGNWVASRVGNRIGLRNAVIFMGAIGSTIATPLFFYAPQWFHGDFLMISIAGVIYGAALGGFVPLSALMPILVPKNRAGALSVLSLGAGASTWVGPAIVAIFRSSIGISGIVWIFTGMYALSVLLMIPLREPRQLRSAEQEERSSRAQQNDGRVAAH